MFFFQQRRKKKGKVEDDCRMLETHQPNLQYHPLPPKHKPSRRCPPTARPMSLSHHHSSPLWPHSSALGPRPRPPTVQNTFSTSQQNSSQFSSPPALSDPHSPPLAPEPATYKPQSPNPGLLPPLAVRLVGVELRIRPVGPFL